MSVHIAPTARVSESASVTGDARVTGNAQVHGSARVHGAARVYGSAEVCGAAYVDDAARVGGTANVYGAARVGGNAHVYENAQVGGNAHVYRDAWVGGNAWVRGNAQVGGKTPTAQIATNGGSQHPDKRKAGGHGPTLADEVEHMDWRQYEPAIRRQEKATGRPAPPPTEPSGKDGQPRISPRFVEWLMALPDGHVTGVPGLSRAAQLRLLGNGVYPPQVTATAQAFLHDEDLT